ncbi:MAG: type I restriction enzyme HsdR N-terminal domain-containing protein [Planctomycetaceae bacterium]|nr:type I restriction enzyme HsdR N-terminal domain-containing protein [Planctomycetaceae bacterium]
MALDKATLQKLKRYAQVFKDAADRGANESDTVMYLVKFFEDVLNYDSLAGEISKEVSIKDRYCDFGIKLNGSMAFLVEAKAAGIQTLREKNIEQAENYASRCGIRWVLLTNGIQWQLYHLTFNEGEGIVHDLAFEVNLPDVDLRPDVVWASLEMLTKDSVSVDVLSNFWNQKKALAPASLVRVLFSEPVLSIIRRELNRNAEARLEMTDVFAGVKEVLSRDALLSAGDIALTKKRKKRRKVRKVDTATGQAVEVEVEEEIDSEASDTPSDIEPQPQPGQTPTAPPAAAV